MVLRRRPFRPPAPSTTHWSFPTVNELRGADDMVAVGADLEPATILAAYTSGYFPMPVNRRTIGWFHPDPRGVIPLDGLIVSRSLRRSTRRYTTTVNQAFDEVLAACADPSRPLGWIDNRIMAAYSRLHQLGWAHSIEAWDDDGLAGGLYGLSIGGLFAGESMFHRRTDASKVALVTLVELIAGPADALLDVQWVTPHLAGLGAIEVPREDYVPLLEAALQLPPPTALVEAAPVIPATGDDQHS